MSRKTLRVLALYAAGATVLFLGAGACAIVSLVRLANSMLGG